MNIGKDKTISEIYSEFAKFMKEVFQTAKELPIGQKKEFVCPICGRTAFVSRTAYNGHIHAICECGIEIHQ